MWTSLDAMKLIQALHEPLKISGYGIALGGSLLIKGESANDLDLIIFPLDTTFQDITKLNWVLTQIGGLTLKVPLWAVHKTWYRKYNSHDQKHVEIWETQDGKKVDIFLLS